MPQQSVWGMYSNLKNLISSTLQVYEGSKMTHKFKSIRDRILVGYLGLFPTLLLVLAVLDPITHHLNFSMKVLIEVIVLVPVTQLMSYPLAGWFYARLKSLKSESPPRSASKLNSK
jgi:hypothetical protein